VAAIETMKEITVLIPTYNRVKALAVTLTSLIYQLEQPFDICISDQSPGDELENDQTVQTIIRVLQLRNCDVRILKNLPPRGMAQQRQFLLDQCISPYSLFLDDDLVLEPYVIRNMKQVLQQQGCGFTGSAVIGLSYLDDWRPHQQKIMFWNGPVEVECIEPKSTAWERYTLHNAANIFHVQQKYNIQPEEPVPYKVAWIGGCVMYDTQKLRQAGGFTFWDQLPVNHCGEDVLAQLRVMKRFGGCGILPSGVYHQELQTTIADRTVNAPECLEI
jgi:GT2 family glycosyltransferase